MKKNVKRSNAAHDRLVRKYGKLYKEHGRDRHWILCNYHSSVSSRQAKLGRKLSKEEKTKVYKNTEYYFYN